jgi:hypothetical protein
VPIHRRELITRKLKRRTIYLVVTGMQIDRDPNLVAVAVDAKDEEADLGVEAAAEGRKDSAPDVGVDRKERAVGQGVDSDLVARGYALGESHRYF